MLNHLNYLQKQKNLKNQIISKSLILMIKIENRFFFILAFFMALVVVSI